MLSRIADSLFWLNRQMERNDCLLRTVRTNYILSFDTDQQTDFRSLILRNQSNIDGLIVLLPADVTAGFFSQWSQVRKDKPTIFSDDTLHYLTPAEADIVR